MKKLSIRILASVIVGIFVMLLGLLFKRGHGDILSYGLPLPFMKNVWEMGYEASIIYPFFFIDLVFWALLSYLILFKLIFKKK